MWRPDEATGSCVLCTRLCGVNGLPEHRLQTWNFDIRTVALTHSGMAAVDLQIAGPRTLRRAAGDVETIQDLGGKPPGSARSPSTH